MDPASQQLDLHSPSGSRNGRPPTLADAWKSFGVPNDSRGPETYSEQVLSQQNLLVQKDPQNWVRELLLHHLTKTCFIVFLHLF